MNEKGAMEGPSNGVLSLIYLTYLTHLTLCLPPPSVPLRSSVVETFMPFALFRSKFLRENRRE